MAPLPTNRLPAGGVVDRDTPVRFTFDGKIMRGLAGDTLASALLANDRVMVARSFKYHRPRGIVGIGAEDPASLVTIGADPGLTTPNVLATDAEIYNGMTAASQNAWPSLEFDIGEINSLIGRFLPAGFYYKTFMGPLGNWMAWEPIIRASAGLGESPKQPDAEHYLSVNQHCDVLVVGSGPAGLMAADRASRTGARVILCEETAVFGGQLLAMDDAHTSIDEEAPADWAARMVETLRDRDNVTLLDRTTAAGYYAQNFVALHQRLTDHLPYDRRPSDSPREKLWRVRAGQVILATGAVERPLIFNENDRPGIMLADAVNGYFGRYAVKPGNAIGFYANNDSAWQVAFRAHALGIKVPAILDTRAIVDDALQRAAAERGIPVHTGAAVVGSRGRHRIKSVTVKKLDGADVTGHATDIELDTLAVSGGFGPNVSLFSQARGQLSWDEKLAAFRPGTAIQHQRSVGSANGVFDLASCIREGAEAGLELARACGYTGRKAKLPAVKTAQTTYQIEPIWQVPSGKARIKTKAFVDLQDDVKASDLQLAVQEGYRSVEHAKRYTTQGMGPDQGKISNTNAFGILADALGKSIPEVGTTTFRQPYRPITFGALAGQHVGRTFLPRRGTPIHSWHREQITTFEPVGDWLRARAYHLEGESFADAVQREAKAARASLGILDASTLGKIDIRGKDSREFLNRVYTNSWSKLAPGKCRYGLMLGEDGMIMDDGVTACLADDHFHMTTTTGGAARVLGQLEDYLQTEWPDLDVYLTSTTEQWAVASVCGPNSRALVEQVLDDFNADPDTFKFMDWRDATMAGVPVRVFRISFTGEMSFEINIPATYGLAMWERLMAAGEKWDITPYGTEAMHLLRAEKGFIIVGQETDGTMTPGDCRMDWIVSAKKGDFIGKRSLSRSDTVRTDRKQLVGLLTQDPNLVLMEGAQVIETAIEQDGKTPMSGHVTSSYFSPNLNRSIAMAVVKGGGARIGETIYVANPGGGPAIPVTISETDFLSLDLATEA